MTIETFKQEIQKGDIYFIHHRPLITIRIIEVVRDDYFEEENVTHLVYSYTTNERKAFTMPVDEFYHKYVETHVLLPMKPNMFKEGDAFYGIQGNLYIVRAASPFVNPGESRNYFVTIVETIDQEDCEEDLFGKRLSKRYILTDGILSEDHLKGLEPFESFDITEGNEHFLEDAAKEFEMITPHVEVNGQGGNPLKKGITR